MTGRGTEEPMPDENYDGHRDEYHGGHTCPQDDWRACEAHSSSRQRWAATALTASLVWHFLDGPDNQAAICGEFHLRWEPVERFACPGAFDACQMCVARNHGDGLVTPVDPGRPDDREGRK